MNFTLKGGDTEVQEGGADCFRGQEECAKPSEARDPYPRDL